jgi:glutamate synthase (NADPH/NADH) large chain
MSLPQRQGLYDPANERDACGVGFVAHIKNKKSHSIVEQGLQILKNLTHRGATGYDPLLGDGAGILIQLPDAFLREEAAKLGIKLPKAGEYACANIFLPQSANGRQACESIVARIIYEEGQEFLGWRDVPKSNEGLAQMAIAEEPFARQVFIGSKAADQDAFERKLFVIRKRIEHEVEHRKLDDGGQFYVLSMSSRTIVYKGMLLAEQVGSYYTDLQDKRVVSALALVHQRFSTNTFPTWDLAHPFRMIAHNGEINTVRGNTNWMAARQKAMSSGILGDDLNKIWPLIDEGQSDSASFDNALELLVMGGYPLAHAMMMLIPEAWASNTMMDLKRRAFYEFHAAIMEPWDGPAAVAFTDGRQIGATLDRNGLRPARYLITKDDIVLMASEMGVLTFPEEQIVKKWRLQPGKMFMIDLEQGRIIDDAELKTQIATSEPYAKWIEESRIFLSDLPAAKAKDEMAESLLDTQQAFGYTQEDVKFLLEPMIKNGEEATGSMGTDIALPILSNRNKPFYNYFKQLFAQVTNPPIDPIREEIVMSLTSFIGPKPNLLGISNPNEALTPRLEVHQPVLLAEDIARLRNIDKLTQGKFKSLVVDITYPIAEGAAGAETAIARIAAAAEQSVADGYNVLILSDRAVSRSRVAVPALLACASVHHHLTSKGLRTSTGLVIDSGSVREVHHYALLAGYGAEAVCPWLLLETIAEMFDDKDAIKNGQKNYVKAIGKGLNKVMSKMGISTYQSYCGAQIFEAIGLNKAFIDKYFTGTATQIEGIGLAEVAEEAVRTHAAAFSTDPVLEGALDAGGEYAFRIRGEEHMWTPDSIAKLQHATRSGKVDTYKEYAALINDQSKRHMTLRGLFEIKPAGPPVALDEVEPAKDIVKRFATGAMSLGSIKMAQGAKPGEGGQLPGHKVSEYIGFLRHSVPGVGLISPPPHHDIYSIEDLAQLIHDLKNANLRASVSVKLVSEVGVGTVAAGVAKAKADHIVVAGFDGGTGASPLSSVMHAGTPWELGLAETQQTLVLNRLRGRVVVQADGQMKTGRDVLIGALLGADEFGFSTAPLVVEGCLMMRKCHLNTCPVGVATQDPVLRKRFTGQPEHVVNYFFFVAEEIRGYMAEMGIKKFEDLIGRADLLDMKTGIEHWKAKGLDFSKVFYIPPVGADVARRHAETQDHNTDKALDHKIVAQAKNAIEKGEKVVIETAIKSENRTFGTILSSAVATKYGHAGLPDDTIHVNLTGTAGQSFGAFLAKGITLELTGEANDYVGKGLSGGRIIVKPSDKFACKPDENIIVGNTVLYGATEGEVFFRGVAGERFAVRNSGAAAVVEGTGDHGCEYMTGGTVVVLGQTGRNFAAGMSGGIAYVLDEDGNFAKRCNMSMVAIEKLLPHDEQLSDELLHRGETDEAQLKAMIKAHATHSGSAKAKLILDKWEEYHDKFVKVFPHEYRRALTEMAAKAKKNEVKEAA